MERAIYLTVLHRLFASGSDRAAERWREDYRISGVEELELHHLYRAMAFLGGPLPKEPSVLGSPRCVKDLIEEALFEPRRDLFTEVDLVFFDTTSIYFEGHGGQTLGRYGHSKDHRRDLRQMIVGIALDSEGWPLCCEMWPGNTTDVKTLLPVVDRMKRRFRVRELCVLADRGMIRKKTLMELEEADPPVRYILGARMRRQKEVSEKVLKSRGAWQEVHPERTSSKDPAPLKVREVLVKGRRYVVCLNEEERRKDAHDREAIVAHLREQLKQGDKSLVGNKGYRRYLKLEGQGHFAIDEDRIDGGGAIRRYLGAANKHRLSHGDRGVAVQATMDGRGHDPHDQGDHGNPAHLPQVRRDDPGPRVLHLPGFAVESGTGETDGGPWRRVGMGGSAARAGQLAGGGSRLSWPSLSVAQSVHRSSVQSDSRGRCGGSAAIREV